MVDDVAIGCLVGNSDHNLLEFIIVEIILREVEYLDGIIITMVTI